MDLESWLKQGTIKPFKSAKTQIDDLLTSAKSDLEASKELDLAVTASDATPLTMQCLKPEWPLCFMKVLDPKSEVTM